MSFEPAEGKARWRVCYEVVSALKPGDIVTYAEIEDICACSRGAAQAAMIRASVELGRDGHNQVETRINIGWLVIAPDDAVPLVHKQRTKAERADDRTAGRINAVQLRRGELSPERRAEVDHEQRVAVRKAAINGKRRRETRTLADRVSELEKATPHNLRIEARRLHGDTDA